MKRRVLAILLALCFFTLPTPIPARAEGETSHGDGARFTVLVLDVSGPQTFEESPSFLNLWGATYTSDSSFESVKAAAQHFLDDARMAVGENYFAIVAYAEEATVACGFTDDIDLLQETLDNLRSVDENRSIAAGLACAQELLDRIDGENAIKNLLLCTTGLTDCGDYRYQGHYSEETVASDWQNKGTEIRLYAYANVAMEYAYELRESGVNLYVLGIFDPVEEKLPNSSALRDVAKFLRLTSQDLASSDETFYVVHDGDDLDFVFGELEDDLTGSETVRLFNYCDKYYSSDRYDPNGGSLGMGGYYEEVTWGPALFETPSTMLYQDDISSPDTVNRNLALLCANLCGAAYNHAYILQAYLDLGFSEDDVFLYSYPDSARNRGDVQRDGSYFAQDRECAFAIGSRSMQINGQETDVLLISLKGTDRFPEEFVPDYLQETSRDFYGYIVWEYVNAFQKDVFAGIQDFVSEHSELGSRPVKILVTGHSLGGGAANLIAARLNMDPWFAAGVEDIYCYTFGAMDSLLNVNDMEKTVRAAGSMDAFNELAARVMDPMELFTYRNSSNSEQREMLIDAILRAPRVPIREGFSNIINVFNTLDDVVSPNGWAGALWGKQSVYGKFGELYLFTCSMDKRLVKGSKFSNHEIVGYIQAVRNGLVGTEPATGKVRILICCPVDVDVYRDKTCVCSIRNDEVLFTADGVEAGLSEDRKIIVVPAGASYRTVITATDEGTMDCIFESLDPDEGSTVLYSDVPLETGQSFEALVPEVVSVETVELYTTDETGLRETTILPDGVLPEEPEATAALEPTPKPTQAPTEAPAAAPAAAAPTEPPAKEKAEPEAWILWALIGAYGGLTVVAVAILIFLLRQRRTRRTRDDSSEFREAR